MIKTQSGFTLLELVIVIILMGIMATGVYIEWPGSSINLDAQAKQLANDLRYTQALSMTKNQRYRLVRTSASTYQITDSSGTPVMLALGNTTLTLNAGITFGSFTNLPNNLVVFNGQGVPYIDTTLPGTALASTATITLTADGDSEIVSITPQTGRVTAQ